MSFQAKVKRIMPSALWNYLRLQRRKYILSQYLKLSVTCMDGVIFLGESKDYESTGRIFDGEQYYSQAYQDLFLDRFIFNRKERGFFLDIGGNDPTKINNTYFFEKNRNWSGLAFEPVENLREKWKTERKTECLPYALGNMTGETEFCEYEDAAMSGFSSSVKFEGKINRKYKVPVKRLADILSERGIKHIDFVSLDVEGAELEVLNGIDFENVNISCFTIENNKGLMKEANIRKFMINKGYKIRAKLWLDEVYTK